MTKQCELFQKLCIMHIWVGKSGAMTTRPMALRPATLRSVALYFVLFAQDKAGLCVLLGLLCSGEWHHFPHVHLDFYISLCGYHRAVWYLCFALLGYVCDK